ncbi:hypothetical protein KUTeg_023859 [Tegillarca granosa]|uniref:C-factor n=1 Tax=Tegillarca granosa TaxID=220873 RepID=A0ABQ9E390_TEGGR|nr:hypothetical protein KUTeg_023859 [Tegillarca granosa]
MALCPRSVLITGANRGLGLEFVKQFLSLPKPPEILIATCRDVAKAERSYSPLDIVDVGDTAALESFRNEVDGLLQSEGLNVLLNNAGIHIRKDLQHTEGDMLMENFRINTVVPFNISKNTNDADTVYTETKSDLSDKGLNVLINNAAITFKKQYIGNNSRGNLLESFDVNVVSPILLVQTFLPLLKKAAQNSSIKDLSCNKAAIINISSLLGSIESNKTGGMYPYRTSKAALNMVTKNLSVDLRNDGILVTSIHPGWVQTDMGGANADLTTSQSVEGCLQTLGKLNSESSGLMYDFRGKVLPY